ncbi:Phenylacetone monooxygenase [Methylibium sp. T29-B]|uniref:flavin-containing monooxygenase n=1 Tax=Methylibium sp. T29-B TaxID=1437443 RepID=UPI0003F4396F|nr:NAD(P)/FAD-dependent oxidoreductase [Methylibium sp. T29-B]EWS62204.1 Phenylacetone monooxygenase [Methylibium sp. T29-B]
MNDKTVAKATKVDAVVIGAGIAGLYQVYRLREQGFDVQAFEAGSNVGGTWYWNRYPGARFDSTAEVYQFWFSEDLYKGWKPSERFPAQPESERWLNYVADRCDLRKHYRFSTRVEAAHYDEAAQSWSITTDQGDTVQARFLITCCGMLSAPLTSVFPGQGSFKGQLFTPRVGRRSRSISPANAWASWAPGRRASRSSRRSRVRSATSRCSCARRSTRSR